MLCHYVVLVKQPTKLSDSQDRVPRTFLLIVKSADQASLVRDIHSRWAWVHPKTRRRNKSRQTLWIDFGLLCPGSSTASPDTLLTVRTALLLYSTAESRMGHQIGRFLLRTSLLKLANGKAEINFSVLRLKRHRWEPTLLLSVGNGKIPSTITGGLASRVRVLQMPTAR